MADVPPMGTDDTPALVPTKPGAPVPPPHQAPTPAPGTVSDEPHQPSKG